MVQPKPATLEGRARLGTMPSGKPRRRWRQGRRAHMPTTSVDRFLAFLRPLYLLGPSKLTLLSCITSTSTLQDPEDQAVKMGLLDTGTAFPWNEAKKVRPLTPLSIPAFWPLTFFELQHADYIRQHGISQFISIYRNSSQRTDAPRTWGDELEYAVVAVDHAQKTAKLSIRQEETLEELEKLGPDEELRRDGCGHILRTRGRVADLLPARIAVPAFHPECGRFMIESVPGEPYTPSIMDLLTVEKNMHHRYATHSTPDSQVADVKLGSQPSLGPIEAESRRDPPDARFVSSPGSLRRPVPRPPPRAEWTYFRLAVSSRRAHEPSRPLLVRFSSPPRPLRAERLSTEHCWRTSEPEEVPKSRCTSLSSGTPAPRLPSSTLPCPPV